jgi:hypothetical protein
VKITLTAQQQDKKDNPLTRSESALGVAILPVGSVLPHRERWTMRGIALTAFSDLY